MRAWGLGVSTQGGSSPDLVAFREPDGREHSPSPTGSSRLLKSTPLPPHPLRAVLPVMSKES